MNISLSPEWTHFVDISIESGPFETPEEVIHAALRLLKGHGLKPLPVIASETDLEMALLNAVNSGTTKLLTDTAWSQFRMVVDQIGVEER